MSNSPSSTNDRESAVDFDAVIVGAGFAGLGMLKQIREAGFNAHVFETGDNVGGTWYWNRYPGICCDSEYNVYQFGFDQKLLEEWDYKSRYPTGPEVLSYLNHFADRYDLRKDISFSTRVNSAEVDVDSGLWTIKTSDGQEITCRYFITGVGCLSASQMPDTPGIHSFKGKQYHTGQWPHEGVDFTGLRVGVIGTGSSAVQSIPVIAREAKELVVFQRTAAYSVPARNAPLDPAEEAQVKADYAGLRQRNRQMMNAFGARHLRALPELGHGARRMSAPTCSDKPKTLEGFKRAAKKLKKFHPEITHTAALEQLERLEQLRALEHGMAIHLMMLERAPPAGVDTPEDLQAVRALLAERARPATG